MTVTNSEYDRPPFKGFAKSTRKSYIIHIDKEQPLLYVSLGKIGRGGQGLGRKNRIYHFYVDQNRRVHAGTIGNDSGGQFYRYIDFGELKSIEDEEGAY